jgi:hypothetical protein
VAAARRGGSGHDVQGWRREAQIQTQLGLGCGLFIFILFFYLIY